MVEALCKEQMLFFEKNLLIFIILIKYNLMVQD